MRNTSDPIKENSNVMNAQGGEKKVMKKILSVALSTAMAFSMFASVAFGDTAVSPQQQFDALKAKGIFNGYPDGTAGLDKDMTRAEFAKVITKLLGLKEITGTLSYTDKNYTAKNWAVPYIEAVTAAGIMEGKNVEKKIFDFNGKVTVSEMATILTRALDLEIPAETNNNAADWAKGYVQAAINAGLIDSKANFGANASRELLVGAAYAIDQAQSLKVASYEVSEGGKVVTFKMSDGESVKVTLDKALEANKDTEVSFKYNDRDFKHTVNWKVEAATKLQSATSTNLKEVDVAYDGKVDKVTATDKDNYSITQQGTKPVKSATLLEDGKTVRLLIDGTFTQGYEYTVAVKNIKSSTGTVLSASSVKFTSADNTLPTVSEVKSLGNKAIKVTFSEPVRNVASNNFQLNDKTFVGSVTKGANEREVILKDYAGNLAIGSHKLTTSLVEDYAGLKSLSATNDFTVAEDKEGPTVTEISATLEKVTVTFNEEVDPESVKSESFYWLSGTTKKTGKATQIAGNVYEVDFGANDNRLPGYETTLYIDVKDYSGNVNAVKEHKVTASVDLTRPKVSDVRFGEYNANTLRIKFDKAVNASDRTFYTVKKGDDVYPVSSATPVAGTDYKEYELTFAKTLPDGDYSLKVTGVKDKTTLGNQIEDYSTTFKVDDVTRPSLTKEIDANNANRTLVVTFDKKMDLASISDPSHYYFDMSVNGSGTDKIAKSLPAEATIRPILEGRAVVIVFPEYVQSNVRTSFPETAGGFGTVRELTVVGVKSAAGNVLNQTYAPKAVVVSKATATKAEQKDYRTIEVTFDQPISQAYVTDFAVSGASVSSVSIKDSGDVVEIKTSNDLNAAGNTVSISGNNGLRTYAGNTVNSGNINSIGGAAPKVAWNTNQTLPASEGKFTLPFTTTLASANAAQYGSDLEIRMDDEVNKTRLANVTDYKTTWTANGIQVEILNTGQAKAYTGKYTVQVIEKPQYIESVNGVRAEKSDVYTVQPSTSTVIDAPKVDSNDPTVTAAVVAVKATAQLPIAATTTVDLTAKNEGVAANNYSVSYITNADLTSDVEVAVNGKAINIQIKDADVTAKAIADKLAATNGVSTIFDVKVTGTDAATPTAPTGVVTTTGGKDAVSAYFTVTANKAVADLEGVVVTGTGVAPQTFGKSSITFSSDRKVLTVKVPADYVLPTTGLKVELLKAK
ncbi:S-layer homology domain-containing protein [Paenibacillus taichungensis]|uniref:S-layer homology domain-containing protein n=1 Tax=Paenibacillus taichungensis TaxID=484184 RepID=UPI0039A39490